MRIGCLIAVCLVVGAGASFGQAEFDKVQPRNEETFQAIMKAGEDPNRDVRGRVAWVLSQIDRDEQVATLRELAKDPAPAVRAAALRAIVLVLGSGAEVETQLDVPVIDPTLRFAALYAARFLRFEQRDRLLRASLNSPAVLEREQAVLALQNDALPDAMPLLQQAMEDPAPVVRRAAALVFGRIGDTKAMDLVVALCDDSSAVVRAGACESLGLLKVAPASRTLARAVNDDHFVVRRKSIQALAAIGDPEDSGAVQGRIAESDFTIREAACVALAQMIHPSSPPFLADRMADEVVEVRKAAAESLVRFPPDMAYEAVLKYIDYMERQETRRYAWWVLGEFAHPNTADTSLEYIDDRDPQVRGYALRILRKLGDRRVIPHVTNMLKVPAVYNAAGLESGEAMLVAANFRLPDATGVAMLSLRLTANPPLEPIWLPSQELLEASIYYVGEMNHQPAVGVIRTLLDAYQRDRIVAPLLAEALKKMTGEETELDFSIGPYKGNFFIDVRLEE